MGVDDRASGGGRRSPPVELRTRHSLARAGESPEITELFILFLKAPFLLLLKCFIKGRSNENKSSRLG